MGCDCQLVIKENDDDDDDGNWAVIIKKQGCGKISASQWRDQQRYLNE